MVLAVLFASTVTGPAWTNPVNLEGPTDGIFATYELDPLEESPPLRCEFGNFSIPAGAIIEGVQIHVIEETIVFPNPHQFYPELVVNIGTETVGNGINLSTGVCNGDDCTLVFGTSEEEWGISLTANLLNDPDFHAEFRILGWDSPSVPRLDSAKIIIFGCNPDYTGDGNADQDDVACLIDVIASNTDPCTSEDADFNGDGNVDQEDIVNLVDVIAGGNCP